MIDLGTALYIARKNFPIGPEMVARTIQAKVLFSPLKGCEGWCVSGRTELIIRINSESPRTRQRFTLAHELAHFFLGGPTDIWSQRAAESSDGEEAVVNRLAAEMLLPKEQVLNRVTTIPIPRDQVAILASVAMVSEVMVARRIVDLRNDLGLRDAYVADVSEGKIKWIYPRDSIASDRALRAFAAMPANGTIETVVQGFQILSSVFTTDWSSTVLVQIKAPNKTPAVGAPG